MYATEFVGNFIGNVSGSVSGRAGQADKLSAPTVFRLSGDVTSNNITFDGQQGTVTFNTNLDASFINDLPTTITTGTTTTPVESQAADEFIINRNGSLYKLPRSKIFQQIKGLTPIGSIIPFAGIINDQIEPPAGWLLCDGKAYLQGDKGNLFTVIGHSFKSKAQLTNEGFPGDDWFAVPDLRGRFPLGRDNMGRGYPDQDKNANGTLIDPNDSRDRLENAAADTLGASSGVESREIEVGNLPEHEHNMTNNDGEGTQFHAFSTESNPIVDSETNLVPNLVGNNSGSLYERSGGVDTQERLGQPIDIMNPFLTINYIIYAGE